MLKLNFFKLLKIILVVALLGLGVGCEASKAKDKNSEAKAGKVVKDSTQPANTGSKTFPDFKVKDLSGQEIALSKYRGKIIILDLFATSCPPCRKEIPHFIELQEEYAEQVAIVALSYDWGLSEDKLKEFIQQMKINYDIYWGSKELASYVGLRAFPHTLVIDQQGRQIRSYVGYSPKSVFEADIKSLLVTEK